MRIAQLSGFTGLTLSAVAKEIGCTSQALNARFGSRKGLLVEYADWTTERDIERFERVRESAASPLAAIRMRFMLPVAGREEELSESGNQIRMLSLIAEATLYPELAESLTRRNSIFERQLALLIEEAVGTEELKVDEPSELAHLLTSATLGGSALWSIAGTGSVLDEVQRLVEQTLDPYRIPTGE